MSRSSFPRQEHAALLRDQIRDRLKSVAAPMEVVDRGLDQYRCCYRFGLRRPTDAGWKELSVHFQVAKRLEDTGDGTELRGIIDAFVLRHYGSAASPELPA